MKNSADLGAESVIINFQLALDILNTSRIEILYMFPFSSEYFLNWSFVLTFLCNVATPVAVPVHQRKHSSSPQGMRSPSYSPVSMLNCYFTFRMH